MWINPDGEIRGTDIENILTQLPWILWDGDRVLIDHHEQTAVMTLELHPLLKRANVIPDMKVIGRLNAGDKEWRHSKKERTHK